MWWYRYTLKGQFTPSGRKKWQKWSKVQAGSMEKNLFGLLAGKAPSGLQVVSWKWSKRFMKFTLFASDGETHVLQWKED